MAGSILALARWVRTTSIERVRWKAIEDTETWWSALHSREPMNSFHDLATDRAPHNEQELAQFERTHGLELPAEYRAFLKVPGPCTVSFPGRRALRFHRFEELAEFADFFSDPRQKYEEFLPIGSDDELQEVYALCLRGRSRGLVSRFSHETVPEDWHEDAEWQPQEHLLSVIAESGGDIPI